MIMRLLAVLFCVAITGCAGRYAPGLFQQNSDAGSSQIVPHVFENHVSQHWLQLSPNTVSKGVWREIVSGPDKNMWFANNNGFTLVRLSMSGAFHEFALKFSQNGTVVGYPPVAVVVGADGKFYLTCGNCTDTTGHSLIGVSTIAGGLTVHRIPSTDVPGSNGMGLGSDGNVWFAEQAHIARITTAGAITEFAYPSKETQNFDSHPIAGPDGNVWFTEYFKHKVAKINPTTHAITEFDVLSKCSGPHGMSVGPDNNLYIICSSNTIAKVTTSGAVTVIGNPVAGTSLTAEDIIRGPDGHIWIAGGANADVLADYNTATHVLTVHSAPFHTGLIEFIAAGPDGNIWGTESGTHVDVFVLAALSVSPTSLTFTGGNQMKTLTATYSGPSTLSAVSANTAIATVVAGTVKNTFVVTSHAIGNTTITIKDAIGNSFSVPVSV